MKLNTCINFNILYIKRNKFRKEIFIVLTNIEKVKLIEEIEERLNINLERHQLEYIFNKNNRILFTSPRRYGKDLMAAVRAIVNSLATPNRKTAILAYGDIAVRQVLELLDYVSGPLMRNKRVCFPSRVTFKNGSEILVFNGKELEQMRGYKVDEVIIQEAFMYNSSTLDVMLARSFASIIHNDGFSISLIGTPNAISSSFLYGLSTSRVWSKTMVKASDMQNENL